ncbi:hypothetical protein [Exiguobacterium sp. UBA3968]|uniref:hypothetical protein n=1 Tax=Exiguobacterium sp. UBA3968 TaxID=1946492 RepID=UPI0025BF9A90|nr:hypothetical protein [Exiguobacterium sp. UBA3968]
MITYQQARVRNLKMKMIKSHIEDGFDLSNKLTDEDLKRIFYFKASDIINFKTELIEDGFIKESIQSELQDYIEKHKSIDELDDKVKVFNETYLFIKGYYSYPKRISKDEYFANFDIVLGLVEELHWYFLPIFEEQFIINRDLIPEENLTDFYNHFHSIEDLNRWIKSSRKWKSTQGDLNLNFNLDFRVYSSRWGHDDVYKVKRIPSGWEFSHLSYQSIKCSPNATGVGDKEDEKGSGLFGIFRQDSIEVEIDGVKYAFEELWKTADETEMSTKELQMKLNDISDWIGKIERAVKDEQPSWVGYY